MDTTFDNVKRDRYYGLRIGDIVRYNIPPYKTDEREYKVVRYGFMDNNRVYLQGPEGDVFSAVAEWCEIVKKVEDIKDRTMAPDMLIGLDNARKEELHNDAVDAVRCGIFGVPSRPVFIGADFGHGKDLRSLMLIENASGKVIYCSKDAIISINSDMIAKVRENDFGHLFTPLNAEWNAKLNFTHKQARQFRKLSREVGLHKPRLPRKLKKKLKTDFKLMRYEETKCI